MADVAVLAGNLTVCAGKCCCHMHVWFSLFESHGHTHIYRRDAHHMHAHASDLWYEMPALHGMLSEIHNLAASNYREELSKAQDNSANDLKNQYAPRNRELASYSLPLL